MTTVTIHKAKTQLSKLIEQVERGEEVVIARGKEPVARLVAYVQERPRRGFGSIKARATIGPSSGNRYRRMSIWMIRTLPNPKKLAK
jgi:prevent-host-death family protein